MNIIDLCIMLCAQLTFRIIVPGNDTSKQVIRRWLKFNVNILLEYEHGWNVKGLDGCLGGN